ncbi:MAG TPA: ArsR family transcriptional regulator [Bacteroidia bacterium]|nr:ArsR family transcriptional regulator [Bacteroidia bacterium]
MAKAANHKVKNPDLGEISEMFKAIAYPGRLEIMELFCNCGCERMSVKNVYEKLKIEQPVASKHLGILKRSGLMTREKEKNYTYFRLNMDNPIAKCLVDCFRKKS